MPELNEKPDFFERKETREEVAGAWREFCSKFALNAQQEERFKRYFDLLMHYNKQVNLTAIVSARGVIKYHFTDSLMITQWMDMSQVKGLVDVGAGAGFPSLPLKIMYPHVPVLLIEPNGKKRRFLEMVAQELGLEEVQTFSNDWRTFVRTTEGDLNLFVSRAALPVEELCRMFKPASAYNDARLVYWASEQWEVEAGVSQYITEDHSYKVGTRKRRLIFLQRPVD